MLVFLTEIPVSGLLVNPPFLKHSNNSSVVFIYVMTLVICLATVSHCKARQVHLPTSSFIALHIIVAMAVRLGSRAINQKVAGLIPGRAI